MKCTWYLIATSLIAAGVTLCHAQTPTASLTCYGGSSQVSIDLVGFNLAQTMSQAQIGTQSAGLGAGVATFQQGVLDAALDQNLETLLSSIIPGQSTFQQCIVSASNAPGWGVHLAVVSIASIQFVAKPVDPNTQSNSGPFLRITVEYPAMNITPPGGNGVMTGWGTTPNSGGGTVTNSGGGTTPSPGSSPASPSSNSPASPSTSGPTSVQPN